MNRIFLIVFIFTCLVAAIGMVLYLEGIWIPHFPSEKKYPIRGIDVSHHQGSIDWKDVAENGVDFAFIKATEGGDWTDRRFKYNWEAARKQGILCGAYHYFTFRTSGLKQAQHYIKTVPRQNGILTPAIDLEFWGNSKQHPTQEKFKKELFQFIEIIKEHYGCEPVIYTTDRFYRAYLKNIRIEKLWIRNVFTRPRGFARKWTFWQFSGHGRVPGIEGPVDLNVFNLSIKELEKLKI